MPPATPQQAPPARPLPQEKAPPDADPCAGNPTGRPVLGDAGFRAAQTANKSPLPGSPLPGAKPRAPLSPLPTNQAPIAGKSPALTKKVWAPQPEQEAPQPLRAGEAEKKAENVGRMLELLQLQHERKPKEPEHAKRDAPGDKEAAAAIPEDALQAGSQGKGTSEALWSDLGDDLQVQEEDTPLKIHSQKPRKIKAQRAVRKFSYSQLFQATDGFLGAKENVLGEGGQARVFRGKLFLGRRWVSVAIKRFFTVEDRRSANDDEAEASFYGELDILREIRHPNIVTLLGYCEDPMCLVYEFLEGGNLADHLYNTSDKHGQFGWDRRVKAAIEVCSAIQALHHYDPPVLHSDIKPENVLLDVEGSARLADFGMASALPIEGCIGGTDGYMDPDYLVHGNSVTLAADVYALGVLLKHLLTGMTDWHYEADVLECNNVQALVVAAKLDDAAQWPGTVAQRVAALSVRCTLRKPNLRPTIDEMLEELEGAMKHGQK